MHIIITQAVFIGDVIPDVNECAPNGGLGPCQQVCTNTIGSFYCSCYAGYAISADGRNCQGKGSIWFASLKCSLVHNLRGLIDLH